MQLGTLKESMNNNLHAGNTDTATTGNGREKLVESPGGFESFQAYKYSDPSPDAQTKSAGMATSSEKMRRPMHRLATPDLQSNCPICGNPYQPGEGVLALACLSVATSIVPFPRAAAHCDPVILGHYACVLPRLLTLLASFQPENRFVEALKTPSAGQFALRDKPRDHDCISSKDNQL